MVWRKKKKYYENQRFVIFVEPIIGHRRIQEQDCSKDGNPHYAWWYGTQVGEVTDRGVVWKKEVNLKK